MKKKVKIIIPIVAVVLVAVLLAVGIPIGYKAYAPKADIKLTIDKDTQYKTLDGFGTSACWWAQMCPDKYDEMLAKELFSKEGLGLNIYRYNIGGGERENPNTILGNEWHKTESFYYYDEAAGEYKYDFTRDAEAQQMLDLALSYGVVDTVVLFANSPHYSMTETGRASGSENWWQSNLPRKNYDAYADYFLTITEYFLNKGVPVKYISPINEPQWMWGVDNNRQEGCYYSPEEFFDLYSIFAEKIRERKLPVKLSGPESGTLGDDTNEWLKKLYTNEATADVMGTLSYHSYWCDSNVELKANSGKWFDENLPDANIEMSEWCHLPCNAPIDSIDGAVLMARVMANDLEFSSINSWTSWVGANQYSTGEHGEKYSDAFFCVNDEFTEVEKAMRYYAMAHFSKFIPKGSVRIDTKKNVNDLVKEKIEDSEDFNTYYVTSAVSFLTPEGKIVCVAVNEGAERELKFKVDADNMQVYVTTQEKQLENTYNGAVTGITFPEKSIVTVVFD